MGKFNPLRLLALPVLLVLAIVLHTTNPALGLEGPGGVGIMPANPTTSDAGWFVYTVDPGQVIEDEAKIINNDEAPMVINIDVEDAGSLSDGGFALSGKENSTEIGVWTQLESNEVTVPANGSVNVKFKITVPQDAGVGEHAGGIVVWRSDKKPDATVAVGGGGKVNVISRVGARIYLTVRGDVKQKLRVASKRYLVTNGELHFVYRIKNEGNVRAEPQAQTALYGIFGPAGKADINGNQITPNHESTVDMKWTKRAPLFGPYLAVVTLHDAYKVPEGLNVVQPAKDLKVFFLMFLIPWNVASWVLLALAIFWLMYQFLVWRRLARIAAMPVSNYRVKRAETLPEIAARYGLPWKLVATINELKPPYVVKEGDTISLPDPGGERSGRRAPNYFAMLLAPAMKFFKKFKKPNRSVNTAQNYEIAVVDPGDTLKDVAAFFKVTPQSIVELNRLKPPYKLRPGQELKIPQKAKKIVVEQSPKTKKNVRDGKNRRKK